MARVLSSTVQYAQLVLQLAIEFSVRSWVHNTPRLQFKTKSKTKSHFIVGFIYRKLSAFVSGRVEIFYMKISPVLD